MIELQEKKDDLSDNSDVLEPTENISIEELEKKSKDELILMVSKMEMKLTREEHFAGPLPHPKILKEYEQVLPGSAERIVSMAESQAKHRQEIEKTVITSNVKDSRLGVIFAFIIGLVGVLGGVFSIAMGGAAWAGALISGASLVSIVSAFIYGTRSERKERIEKSKNED